MVDGMYIHMTTDRVVVVLLLLFSRYYFTSVCIVFSGTRYIKTIVSTHSISMTIQSE